MMEAIKLPTRHHEVDIIATDKHGEIVLIVEAKAQKLQTKSSAISQLKSYLNTLEANNAFAMLADLDEIEIFKVNQENDFKKILSLKTVNILKYYDAEFPVKKIFALYFITLLEAWLRDLAYHWKSVKPPASEELATIGLLDMIKQGDTYSQNDYYE
ncbi:MAG TPA: type I restriction enzyme HsdR N-terminal domain-containing protein [Nodularia sp. (in: cyanobacteria)]|nr:type I restriction enzyme HsdR N-terminal domain-containing protein [Nodularia sp. (in: cyanobacteria)]